MREFEGMRTIPRGQGRLFNLLFLFEHYFPNSAPIKRIKDTTRLRIAEHLRAGGKGTIIPVERKRGLSPEEFQRRYLATGTPVIIEGAAAEWPCVKQWSFDVFKERYGKESIKLVQRKGLSDDDFVDEKEFSEEIIFGDFLDQVLSGGMKYMRFSPLLEKFPELLQDFDKTFCKGMTGGKSWGSMYQLFIGGKKTFTPLHNAMSPFFFVNVTGVKRWALIPSCYLAALNPPADGYGYNHSDAEADLSNVERFPGFESIDRWEAVMQPADVLYVPAWMWHSVQNEAPTIGVRWGFVYPWEMVAGSPTLAFIRLFAARNPSTLEALYYTLFKGNLADRDKWLLNAKVFRE